MRIVLLAMILVGVVVSGTACSRRDKLPSKGVYCGGTANFPCPNTMFCNLKEPCGGYDVEGYCKRRPTNCPADIAPVCGCDSNTYSNGCLANAAGITIKYAGECK